MNRGLIRYVKGYNHASIGRARSLTLSTPFNRATAANWRTHRQHVAQLKARHGKPHQTCASQRAERSPPLHRQWIGEPQSPMCPRCSNPMVLRTAGRGDNKGKTVLGMP